MSENFYRAFEEKHRGSRELITSRLKVYLPFILPLKRIYPIAPAIDLGCGRGEWLELLLQESFLPRGVDQDEGMLQGCMNQSLPAEKGDIFEYLSMIPDESQTIVSAFHVVEHISFEQLCTLVSEALRVLKPGGLLIMETPNPENIVVATKNFYLDPTHQKPIPPDLLSFVPEYYGFLRTKIIRLQESRALFNKEYLSLNDILGGVSPDYAVVAQKAIKNEYINLFDEAFDQKYGLELNVLAERYDAGILAKVGQAEQSAQQAEAKAERAEQSAQQAAAKVERVEEAEKQAATKVKQVEKVAEQAVAKAEQAVAKAERAEVKAQEAEIKAEEEKARTHHFEHTITEIYASRSWRITYPMRWSFHQARLLREHGLKSRSKSLVIKIAKPVLKRAFHYVDGRPQLRHKLLFIIRRVGFYARFKSIYQNRQPNQLTDIQHTSHFRPLDNVSNLSPRAQQIYYDLKIAVEKNKEQQ